MDSQIINAKTREQQALSRDHHLPSFTDYKQLNEKGARTTTKAEGVYTWDSEGNKILNATAGLWYVNVGYGREELVQAATRQMCELPFHNLFLQTVYPPAIELTKAVADVASEGMNHVFFTGPDSEANDIVLRMARYYWATKGQPQKRVVIGRWNGYHGSTVAGVSLGGMKALYEQDDLPIPGTVHIAQPYWYGEDGDMLPDEFGIWVAKQLEKRVLEVGEENVAVFIAEPIQGTGDVIVPLGTYRPKIREIPAKYDILFTADEVICGFGYTGEWFGSQYYGNASGLMPIAKDLTSGYALMGGVVVRDKIVEVLNQGDEFYHGFTYSGHPVAVAVILKNIRILCEEKITEKAKVETAPYLQKRWQELAGHPLVGEVHGVGMVAALELVKNKKTCEYSTDKGAGILCREYCFRNGLIMHAVGDTMIISPPLVVDLSQTDELITLARKCLDQTATAILA